MKILKKEDHENNEINLITINDVITITKDFEKEVNEIKKDIFKENGLKVLDIKLKIRNKKLELRRNNIYDDE